MLNAIDLMRDMTQGSEEGEHQRSPHSPTKPLTAILENFTSEEKSKCDMAQVHDQAHPQQGTPKRTQSRSLVQKGRAKSLSAVPPSGSGLKFPSTSAISSFKPGSSPSPSSSGASSSQGRQRSVSTSSKRSTPKRPSTSHGGSRLERKGSLPSRT